MSSILQDAPAIRENLDPEVAWLDLDDPFDHWVLDTGVQEVTDTEFDPWFNFLGPEDQRELLGEIRTALARGEDITELMEAWRITAISLRNPASRAILLGRLDFSDFEEIQRPE